MDSSAPLNALSPSEQLMHSTVRIACSTPSGPSTGTGFFYSFARSASQQVPAIVTNKHVVAGATNGTFSLTLRGQDGLADYGKHVKVSLDQFEQRWVPHPDPQVDLCAMPIAPLVEQSFSQGKPFFFVSLDASLIPSASDLNELVALEDIVMVGYPNGIWDTQNNLPIFRRGITATHASRDYEGRREFLIDAACFPGSSGSPVFLYNMGGWSTRAGGFAIGGVRLKLLGVLYAGPQHTATGEVRIVNVPTQQRAIAVSTIPNNLGLVIKASRLQELDSIFQQALVQGSPRSGA